MINLTRSALTLTALFGVVALVVLECEITAFSFGYRLAIAAVGAIRFVLFLSSAGLREQSQKQANAVIGFSLFITACVAFYGAKAEGLNFNQMLIFQVLNISIALAEISAAFAFAGKSYLMQEVELGRQWEKYAKEMEDKAKALEAKANALEERAKEMQDFSKTSVNFLPEAFDESGNLRTFRWGRGWAQVVPGEWPPVKMVRD